MSDAEQRDLAEAYKSLWAQYLSKDDLRQTIEAHRSMRKPLLRLLEHYVRLAGGREANVLEVGCGTGIDSYLVAEATDARVSGSDLLPEAIRVAQLLGSEFSRRVHFFVDDATQMALPAESFDLVFSQGVVEHFADPTSIMSEQARIVRPGGYIVVDVPQLFSWYTVHKKRQMRAGTWEFGWETQYSYGGLKALGERFGLRPIDRAGYGYDARRDLRLGYLRRAHNLLWRLPAGEGVLAKRLHAGAESVWGFLERHWGHRFLINVVIVFEKPSRG